MLQIRPDARFIVISGLMRPPAGQKLPSAQIEMLEKPFTVRKSSRR